MVNQSGGRYTRASRASKPDCVEGMSTLTVVPADGPLPARAALVSTPDSWLRSMNLGGRYAVGWGAVPDTRGGLGLDEHAVVRIANTAATRGGIVTLFRHLSFKLCSMHAPLAQRQSNGLLIWRLGGSTPPGRTRLRTSSGLSFAGKVAGGIRP